MKKEFNLGERRKQTRENINCLFNKIDFGIDFGKAITIMNNFWKDIIETDEEFIKRLKEARGNCYECGCSLTDEDIDKLVGKKLTLIEYEKGTFVVKKSRFKEFIKIILEEPTATFVYKDGDECVFWKVKDLKKRAGEKLT